MDFKHYGVQIVPRLSGLPIVQVRMKYNHHLAQEIMSYVEALSLGCRAYNIFNKKDVAQTEIHLEFDGSDNNWLKYKALKTEVQILQKEIELKRLRKLSSDLERNF